MRSWSAGGVARAAGAELVRAGDGDGGPEGATVDSRSLTPGALFVGVPGARVDGGTFAAQALAAGAWGVLVEPRHAEGLDGGRGAVLAHPDPVAALGALARAWRRALGAWVIGVTGSTGKTSTKDLIAGLLEPGHRVVRSRGNFNTEIGLPLELASAPPGTEIVVLEMGMRGAGQIAELAAIAEPDVGVIVNIGPVHLELLGNVEAVALAKAELIGGLRAGGTAIVPAGERLLDPHRRADLMWVTFGAGGDVSLDSVRDGHVRVRAGGDSLDLEIELAQAHQLENLLAAVAAALAVGVRPAGPIRFEPSPHRGQRIRAGARVLVIDDCYNANPMSVAAGLEDLAATAHARGTRAVAVLGDMLELGDGERAAHEAAGARAAALGVELLVAVGPLAAAMSGPFGEGAHLVADADAAAALLPSLLRPGDTVLVKGSRGVGLETVVEALT